MSERERERIAETFRRVGERMLGDATELRAAIDEAVLAGLLDIETAAAAHDFLALALGSEPEESA